MLVDHTDQVIASANLLTKLIVDQETGLSWPSARSAVPVSSTSSTGRQEGNIHNRLRCRVVGLHSEGILGNRGTRLSNPDGECA